MMRPLFLAISIFMLSESPAELLRYKFKTGQIVRYSLSDSLVQSEKRGDAAEEVTYRHTGSGKITRMAVGVTSTQSVVEETPTEGITTIETPNGKETRVIPTVTRIITSDLRGRVQRLARRAAGSGTDPGPQMLDGLVFALPEKPVAPGSSWTQTLEVVGMAANLKKMPVKLVSQYLKSEKRNGSLCAKIQVKISSQFKVPSQNGSGLDGSMTGSMTYWHDRALGQDVETEGEMKIVLASAGNIPPSDRIVRTIALTTHLMLNR